MPDVQSSFNKNGVTNPHFSQAQTADTRLGRALGNIADTHPGKSGFLLVPDGVDALAIRLLLADRAERSIDTQYYEIENDLAGRLFIEALLRAADRGVRIRLLLDDYRTKGHDAGLAALRAHPNFEMRIYNPFERRSARFVDVALNFARINRRMHNKSFTVDNQFSVIGGRNIGDHYFSVGENVNFADLDVVCIGPIVDDISNMFDEYWNSFAAQPLEDVASYIRLSRTPISKVIERIARSRAEAVNSRYAEAIDDSMLDKLERGFSDFIWAPCQIAYDLPEKTQKRTANDAALIRRLLVGAFDNAESEVVLISPYFVPRLSGIRRFRELRARDVSVTIVTNSLASNNQIYAHGGYAPVRKPLLKMGITLYELRANANVVGEKHGREHATLATLHTKAFSIDRKKLFVGSFNFDPRSANINTEMGVFIESPELADAFVRGTQKHVPRYAFEVFLTGSGAIRWRARGDQSDKVYDREPLAGFWHRAAGTAARLLPIRGQV